MIEDLKRDSARWRQEQERRSRSGRSTGMIYLMEYPVDMAEEMTGSYAEMKGREDPNYDPNPRYQDPRISREPMDVDMDMDDYDRPAPPRSRHDIDARQPAGRHGVAPVSTGYPPESGYYVSSGPAYSGPDVQPRSLNEDRYRTTGGSTPPTSRGGQPAYGQPGYSATTRATAPSVPVSSYRDPRTGQLVGYDPYAEQPRARGRHG